jgi:hypothetical protein
VDLKRTKHRAKSIEKRFSALMSEEAFKHGAWGKEERNRLSKRKK